MRRGDKGHRYMIITKEQRLKVLELILKNKLTIKNAAQVVGIRASSARMILRRYELTR